jgi:hypothetical protein
MQVVCKDGFSMSVIRNGMAYGDEDHVEIGFPSEEEPLIMPYAEDEERPTRTVYGWVPNELLNKVIDKHGGEL